MPKYLPAIGAVIGALLLATDASQAQGQGPWCAIVPIGPGAVREICHFRTFEACLAEVTGGNRGYCNNNPRWAGGSQHLPSTRRKGRH